MSSRLFGCGLLQAKPEGSWWEPNFASPDEIIAIANLMVDQAPSVIYAAFTASPACAQYLCSNHHRLSNLECTAWSSRSRRTGKSASSEGHCRLCRTRPRPCLPRYRRKRYDGASFAFPPAELL